MTHDYFGRKCQIGHILPKGEKNMRSFKVSKNRLTFLLSGNVAVNCKLIPLLVYHAETPRTLKNTAKALLSCHVV